MSSAKVKPIDGAVHSSSWTDILNVLVKCHWLKFGPGPLTLTYTSFVFTYLYFKLSFNSYKSFSKAF